MTPWLRRTHSGYFSIVVSLILSHVALAVDNLAPFSNHSAPIYTYVRPLLVYYGVVHVLIAAVVVVCLYLDERWWWLARWAFFLSLLTCNTLAVGLLFGSIFHGGAFIAPIGLVALSISSAASWREPTTGPPYRSLNTRAT